MRLVRLSDGCYINPEDVQEITIPEHRNGLTVRMRNGVGHHVELDYRKTPTETLNRLKAELEGPKPRD